MSTFAIPEAALEQDIAILDKKGRGKTYAAKGCVERLLDMGRRVATDLALIGEANGGVRLSPLFESGAR